MYRQKGTPNIPQAVKDEIVRKHKEGMSAQELAREYGKTFKTNLFIMRTQWQAP